MLLPLARARGRLASTGTFNTSAPFPPETTPLFTLFPLEQYEPMRNVLPTLFTAHQDKPRPHQDKIHDTPGQNPATSGQNSVLTPRCHSTQSADQIKELQTVKSRYKGRYPCVRPPGDLPPISTSQGKHSPPTYPERYGTSRRYQNQRQPFSAQQLLRPSQNRKQRRKSYRSASTRIEEASPAHINHQ
ncbi:hypothetical protein HG66A1_09400 [Gimesia chilikensis]|uniref:Uncharacterized protein n=1 Tax=Gimesia chilikensis TaxID=2605989 RepID=A0A517PIH5_9PLAN|nr:hypothetical protein HG66A1_09400 [Gimesia chilikensis]